MKLIIKKYIGKNAWSDIYCVGDIACEKGGNISHAVFEKMKSEQVIHEIDGTKLIEDHYRHKELLTDVKDCQYFQIKYNVLSAVAL